MRKLNNYQKFMQFLVCLRFISNMKVNARVVNNYDCKKSNSKQNFGSNSIAQTSVLSAVQPNFNVKVPQNYVKTGELALPFDTKAHCYKMANGQRVVVVPGEGETVLKTYVNTGSMNEPDKVRGISHYIEHNLFNGSEGLEEGDFFNAVNKMGASTNAATGFAETNYYISSNLLNPEDLEKKIKIHASMLETPLFKQEKLNKEKGIVNSEINMITSNPENIGVNKTLKNLYNINSTSADMIGGTTDNITNLTREDVVDYFDKNYYPANMVTVITGEVEPEKTMQLISKHFTSKKQPPQSTHHEAFKPIEKTKREDIITNKATATSIILGFNGPKNNDFKDNIYMTALANLLTGSTTSRINSGLKALNTFASTEQEKMSTKPDGDRAFLVCADTTEDNCENVIKTFYSGIHSVLTNPPSGDEMQTLKKQLLKDFSESFERSHATNAAIGGSLLTNSLENLNDFEKIVNLMSAKNIQDVARKYFDLNKTALTVVHPTSTKLNGNVSFTGKQAINPDKIKEYKMTNNFKVVTNDTKTDNVHFVINFDADNLSKAKPAAALILRNMLNEGSAYSSEQEFTRKNEKQGIELLFDADLKGFEVNGSCNAGDLSQALKGAKEVLSTPRFDQETFNQAKNDLKEVLLMQEKSADEKLKSEIFKGLPQGSTAKEILESIDSIALQDIISLYSYVKNNAKAQVVVSAPFSTKPELNNILFSEIAQFTNVREFKPFMDNVFKPTESPTVLTDADNKNQADIIQAYKFKTNGNLKDDTAVELLNTILGGGASSRLFMDLREQQKLAYTVRSNYSNIDDMGVLQLKIKTTTENFDTGEVSYGNLQKSLEGFKKHIEKIKSEKVSDNELECAKLKMKNDILSAMESKEAKNSIIAHRNNSPYGISYENQQLDMIDKITPDDIFNAANYIFSNNPVYSIVATENTLKNNVEFLKSLA